MHLIAEEKGAHPDHGEKGGNGAKDRVYRCGTRDLHREVQVINGRIQGGDNPALVIPLLEVVYHGRDALRLVREGGEWCGLRRRARTQIKIGAHPTASICVSIGRLPYRNRPTRCLPFDRIRHPGSD